MGIFIVGGKVGVWGMSQINERRVAEYAIYTDECVEEWSLEYTSRPLKKAGEWANIMKMRGDSIARQRLNRRFCLLLRGNSYAH